MALTPIVTIIRGSTFHPTSLIICMSGLYLLDFFSMAMVKNLSWQHVNTMNWMICGGVGFGRGWLSLGAPIIHKMCGLRQAMHVQNMMKHVHLNNHSGIVMSCD